jgi:TRAP-type C4-dicarboxylate transport system permease large subunit
LLEIVSLIGFFLLLAVFLVKVANLMNQGKLYEQTGIFVGMAIGLIGWGLLFLSLVNGVQVAGLQSSYTITTPDGNVLIPQIDYSYYSTISYLGIANPIIWICGVLTLFESLRLFTRFDRAGQEKTRK